jgi:hydrogenase maturation factor
MKTGKLPNKILSTLLNSLSNDDKRVVVGPSVGEDAAAIDMGSKYLLVKTDPITFTSDNLGWYLVNINSNDIFTMGGQPKWLLTTLLFNPSITELEIKEIFEDIKKSCKAMNISLVGGHTEITSQVNSPIAIGCLIGEVEKNKLITTSGAKVNDDILITKHIGLEGTSILANDIKSKKTNINPTIINNAIKFIYNPGISIMKESQIAIKSKNVSSMHDSTEGGLITGLEELAMASNNGLCINAEKIPIKNETQLICNELNLNPLGLISSGSLIITCDSQYSNTLIKKITSAGINVNKVGKITAKDKGLKLKIKDKVKNFPKFERDEIARYFESK